MTKAKGGRPSADNQSQHATSLRDLGVTLGPVLALAEVG
jgi:hypothetical protein